MSDKTLDLTPSWTDVVRGYLPLYDSLAQEGRDEVMKQFMRMAQCADLTIKHLDLIREAEEGKGKGKPTQWVGCDDFARFDRIYPDQGGCENL